MPNGLSLKARLGPPERKKRGWMRCKRHRLKSLGVIGSPLLLHRERRIYPSRPFAKSWLGESKFLSRKTLSSGQVSAQHNGRLMP